MSFLNRGCLIGLLLAGLLGIAVLAVDAAPLAAQEPAPSIQDDPSRARVGAFVTSLYDIDLQNRSYNIVFWVWFVHSSPNYKPFRSTEIMNAKSYKAAFGNDVEIPQGIWSSVRYEAKMLQDWDLTNFPFDRQRLDIYLEDDEFDASGLIYEADTANSKIDPDIRLEGWKIEGFEVKTGTKEYQTTFGGEPTGGASTYARTTLTILLRRQGGRVFFNLFVGAYAAVIVALLAFFIPPSALPPRFSMITAAIFAVTSNKYIVDAKLPTVSAFTLVDQVQLAAFTAIVVASLIQVVSAYMVQQNQSRQAERLNLYGCVGILIPYVIINIICIAIAAQG